MAKKIFRIFFGIFVFIVILAIAFLVAVRDPAFQTFLAHRVADILSKSLKTRVSIERVEIAFFNKADLVNFYMEDRQHDTMISVKELNVQCRFIDLFHKQINVHSVLMEGGVFYIHRDSSGKKLNLSEVFGIAPPGKSKVNGNQNGVAWDIDLQDLQIKSVALRYLDEKSHLDLKVNIPDCWLAMNEAGISGKKVIDIKSFSLDKAEIDVDLLKRAMALSDTSGETHFITDGTVVKFEKIRLADIRFRLNDHNNDTLLAQGIDFKHLDVSQINFNAQNGKIAGDTLVAFIQSLSAKEKSGFTLENLTAGATISVNEVTLDKMLIKTPDSKITDYLSLHYNSFDDFKDFLSKVRIKAKLSGSSLALKDINYFIRKLDAVKHDKFLISGELDGRINNLRGRGIEIRTGLNTIFKGDFYTKGLPDFYETSLNLHVDRFSTTTEDFKRIYPQLLLPENLDNLGLIYYVGSFDGFVTDFVTKGKLVTSIGSGTIDANFKYDPKRNKASYKGNLALNEFDLSKYFGNIDWLGKISLDARINGKGLTPESLDVQLDGNISSLTAKGYEYRDLKINGTVLKKSFNGLLEVRDKNLDMDFNGKADLSGKIPSFDFNAEVHKADLKNLNLIPGSILLSGNVKSNFTGSKLDNFMGSVDIRDLTVSRDSLSSQVKKILLQAKLLSDQKKEITLESDFVEAEMEGNFTLKELPKALLSFARHTFMKEPVDTAEGIPQQDFSLDLRVYEPGNFPAIIYPKLSSIRNSRVTCDFNSVDHRINLAANIPEATFGNFSIRRAEMKVASAKDDFDAYALVGKVYSGDSVLVDSVILTSKTVDKNIRLDLHVTDEPKINYADITAFIIPEHDKATLTIEPSDIKLGGSNWHFDKGDTIYIAGKKITTHNLVFRTDQQTVYIESYLKNDTSTSVKLTLANTNLNDFARTFTTKMRDISGMMNGKLVVEDVFGNQELYSDFVISDFTLGKELIGDVNLDSRLDSTGKNIIVFASVKGLQNNIEARGYVSIDPKNSGMNIDVDGRKLGLNFLNYSFFTEKYVKNCHGYATIKGTVYGLPTQPLLKGRVHFVHDTVTVSYTNATYRLDNQTATMDEHGFDLGNILIHDIKGREVYGSGRINHEHFKDFALDLKVTSSKPGDPNPKNYIQFLNTTEKESPNFFGVAYGVGGISFVGPINSPVISGYVTTGPGSYCKLPVNSSYETNRYSFYKFESHDKNMPIAGKAPKPKLNGVTFSLNLNITPDARMDIVLDPIAGDVLSCYGSGDLRIDIPKNSSLTMYGNYEIERGNYLFTLKNIVNKKFEINKGGTIDFAGEVYKAKLDLNATYSTRTTVIDLIQDMISATTPPPAALSRVQVDLLLKITGVLERPSIAFDISVIDPDPTIKSYVDQKMALLKNDEAALYNQVFGLLVMNKFIASNSSVTNEITGYNGSNASSTAANTVSEFISSQLSNYLSNLFEFANIQNLDVNLGYNQTNVNTTPTLTNPTLETRQQVQLAVSQRLLNNRLSINAGGNLDIGSGTPGATNVANPGNTVIPTGDVTIEYSLTPNGAWRAKVFNKTNYDYYNARDVNKTGLGISYRQEFDKFSDLKKKKKAAAKKIKKVKKTEDNTSEPAPKSQ